MPVIRERASLSQFAELIGVAPGRLIGLEMDRRGAGTVTLVLEPEEPMSDEVAPPSSFTVDHEHLARLYTADGQPLVRTAGFTTPRTVAAQTSGTFPQLTKGGKKIGGSKGKGGGKRGC